MDRTVEFDHVAPVYDETRGPPSKLEVGTLAELLAGCDTVLDAGIGTGRFAVPLLERQLGVVGVDLSVGMMTRARAKGVTALIRGDIRHLPLKDHSVDGAFTAHVLQLISDPKEVLRELGRIARRVVVVLLPTWTEADPSTGWRGIRERYRELASELGYPLPQRGRRFRHTLEELGAIAPPKTVRVVEGPSPPETNLGDRLARWEGHSTPNPVPPEVHAAILRRLEAELPAEAARWPRQRQERFVAWNASELREGSRPPRAAP